MRILKSKKLNFYAGVILIGLIAWYLYSLGHQISGVREICSEITPGLSISKAKDIAANHGLLRKREISSYPGAKLKDGTFAWFITADLTMGDFACGIDHDGAKVISAKMSEP